MFDDLNTRFNTSYEYIDQDYEDFPKNTMRGTVQSSFLGPRYMLMDREPIYENRRREQYRLSKTLKQKEESGVKNPGTSTIKVGMEGQQVWVFLD